MKACSVKVGAFGPLSKLVQQMFVSRGALWMTGDTEYENESPWLVVAENARIWADEDSGEKQPAFDLTNGPITPLLEYLDAPAEPEVVPWSWERHPDPKDGPIWVRRKDDPTCEMLVVAWSKEDVAVSVRSFAISYAELLAKWEQTDGSPCGWKEGK